MLTDDELQRIEKRYQHQSSGEARTILNIVAESRRLIVTEDALRQCLDAIDFVFHGTYAGGDPVIVTGPSVVESKLLAAREAARKALDPKTKERQP